MTPFWHGLLHGALNGDDRTAGNTVTTVQQAVSLFFQADIRRRCVPSPGHPATDLADVIRRRGTIYLLGREDPYASASPLMTAVAEHVLDTGLLLGRAAGEADRDPSDLAGRDAHGLGARVLDHCQDGTSSLQESNPGCGDLDSARGPPQQGDADLRLELLDLLGERRLGDVQPLGGPTEVTLLGDGHEVAQVADLHS